MRRRGVVLSVCLSIFSLCVSDGFAYSGGAGTVSNPYRIATASDLLELGSSWTDYDKHFIQVSNINLSGWGDNWDGSFSTAVIPY